MIMDTQFSSDLQICVLLCKEDYILNPRSIYPAWAIVCMTEMPCPEAVAYVHQRRDCIF